MQKKPEIAPHSRILKHLVCVQGLGIFTNHCIDRVSNHSIISATFFPVQEKGYVIKYNLYWNQFCVVSELNVSQVQKGLDFFNLLTQHILEIQLVFEANLPVWHRLQVYVHTKKNTTRVAAFFKEFNKKV